MIGTRRLLLRRWRAADAEPFHAMSRDPAVMRTIGPLLSRGESDAAIARQNEQLDRHGCCFWALERRADGAFIGFCGVQPGRAGTPIGGELEIGWRLARAEWGRGYAREAAQASLRWAWANTRLPRVIAVTTPGNARSRGLMERLGMARLADGDFDHPMLARGDPLRAHVTYAIARPAVRVRPAPARPRSR